MERFVDNVHIYEKKMYKIMNAWEGLLIYKEIITGRDKLMNHRDNLTLGVERILYTLLLGQLPRHINETYCILIHNTILILAHNKCCVTTIHNMLLELPVAKILKYSICKYFLFPF